MRTIANCFDTPVWGTCTKVDVDQPCLMPNSRRTPDCVVAVVPDNNIVDLRYPIFITEVIGKKPSKGENEEKYDGYNAACQSLVFAPRAYYCEVYISDAKLYTLEKEPHKGYIRVTTRNYRLYVEDDFKNFLRDICAALIDGMVKLYPIAKYSAACLKQANHRDFLNVPSKRRKKIEPHCWHLFVPKFLNQDLAPVPGDYLATLDFEDPARPDPEPKYGLDFLPSILDVTSETYPVNQHNIDLTNVAGDISEIRAIRDNDGKPVKYDDMTDSVYLQSVNVTVESRCSRLKHFVEEYNQEEEEFLEPEDEEEEKLHTLVTATTPSDDEPIEEGESAVDVEFDGNSTIISGGGSLGENILIYHDEGTIQLSDTDSWVPSSQHRKKTRITLRAEDFAVLSSTVDNIMQQYNTHGTLPLPTPRKSEQDDDEDEEEDDDDEEEMMMMRMMMRNRMMMMILIKQDSMPK